MFPTLCSEMSFSLGVALLGLSCCWSTVAADASSTSTTKDAAASAKQECGVYFAPSTIPGAGMGMFAGKDYAKDSYITTGDIVIPLIDWNTQNLDYPLLPIDQVIMQKYYWLTYA